jgi:hypothetical protein
MRIWRYLDLAKLVSLFSTKSLYFAPPSELIDPFEGYMPRSHVRAHEDMAANYVAQMKDTRDQIMARFPCRDSGMLDAAIADAERKLNAPAMLKDVATRFGVNCWHRNEHESAAMWQLYGNCAAIESTEERLKDSFSRDGINFDDVRYMDFDNDPIEKGHRRYASFIKRMEFQHERETRANVLLKEFGKGELIECDIEKLVIAVYVAPSAAPYYVDAVRAVVECIGPKPAVPVIPSKMLSPPDY